MLIDGFADATMKHKNSKLTFTIICYKLLLVYVASMFNSQTSTLTEPPHHRANEN